MMLVTGPVYGADPATGVYRGPLRVQTINAEIRTNERQPNYQQKDHKDPPFRFQRRPGLDPRAFLFEARVLRAGTRFSTFRGKLSNSAEALPILA